MQTEGEVQYLKYHEGSVRGVAFHPKDRYVFCSGAYDGRVNLYSAQDAQCLQSYSITTVSLARNINAVRFNNDGSKILATTTARRMAVLDVETGQQILSYDNCCFNGRDRAGLAVDPRSPDTAVCCCVDGKGLSLFDLRMELPIDFVHELHDGVIRDIVYLHDSWPWCRGQRSILTVAADGDCKVLTKDGRPVRTIHVGQALNSVTSTPESFDSAQDDGFSSLLMFGGDTVSTYVPDIGVKELLTENSKPIWKLRYTSQGSFLYTACDGGVVRKYRRWPDRHEYMGEMFRHHRDIEDMDISPYDEYLITASQDRSVGLKRLGPPNHGTSEYAEFT